MLRHCHSARHVFDGIQRCMDSHERARFDSPGRSAALGALPNTYLKPQRGEIPLGAALESQPVGPSAVNSSATQGFAGSAGFALGYRISPSSGLFTETCPRFLTELNSIVFRMPSLPPTLVPQNRARLFAYLPERPGCADVSSLLAIRPGSEYDALPTPARAPTVARTPYAIATPQGVRNGSP